MTTYEKVPGVRLRPVEEWEGLMAYTPERPALHWLNPVAWMVIELCDGKSEPEVVEAFREALPSKAEQAAETVPQCLEMLVAKGLVQTAHNQPTGGTA